MTQTFVPMCRTYNFSLLLAKWRIVYTDFPHFSFEQCSIAFKKQRCSFFFIVSFLLLAFSFNNSHEKSGFAIDDAFDAGMYYLDFFFEWDNHHEMILSMARFH